MYRTWTPAIFGATGASGFEFRVVVARWGREKKKKNRDHPDLWRWQRHAQYKSGLEVDRKNHRSASRPSVVAEGDRTVAIYCKGQSVGTVIYFSSFDCGHVDDAMTSDMRVSRSGEWNRSLSSLERGREGSRARRDKDMNQHRASWRRWVHLP